MLKLNMIARPETDVNTIEKPYDFIMGLSSNSMVIIGLNDLNVKQIVKDGDDKEILLFGFENQDVFLESINMFKEFIEEGKSPLKELGFIEIDMTKIFEFLESLERG